MDYTFEDISYETAIKRHVEGTCAIDVVYWLLDRGSASVYETLPKIYQSEKALHDDLDRAVALHFEKNKEDILKRLVAQQT